MLFQYTNLWRIFVHPRRLRLFLAQRQVCEIIVEDESERAASLEKLLSHIPARLPFVDRVEFILDFSQLHYLIIPWHEGVKTPHERNLYAIAFHQQQQGQLSPPMRVAFTDFAYGKNGLAALMSQESFDIYRAMALRCRLRFIGCRSLFDLLWHSEKTPSRTRGLFACIGDVQSSFVLRFENQWHSAFSLHLPAADPQAQLAIANRLAGLPQLDCHVINTCSGDYHPQYFGLSTPAEEKV
ncbi:hypothetical protein GA565_00980 [Rouxiella sp. S1S-2]|uniref:hypothetical protein n=1 Tax=Rouxiella sp. S1S-2 TaxID=2653856 RepID=UPI00126497BE|nr:hypothetical protein [Rouxiella sp. S1S-2]KAB7894664.1 hypothetical protein GA565_00980 [Rouxiella sp. S1S-2]